MGERGGKRSQSSMGGAKVCQDTQPCTITSCFWTRSVGRNVFHPLDRQGAGSSPTDEEPTRLSSHTQIIPYTDTDGIHPDIDASFPRDAEASRDPYFQRVQTSYQSHAQYGQAAVGRSAKQLRDEDRRKMREIALKNGFGASLPRFRKFNLSKEREALAHGITFPVCMLDRKLGRARTSI